MHDLVLHAIDFHFFYSASSGSLSDDKPIPISSGKLSNPVSDTVISAIPQFYIFFSATFLLRQYFISSTFYSNEYSPFVHNIKCFTEVNMDFMGLKKNKKVNNQR